jgi:hypothetical protein
MVTLLSLWLPILLSAVAVFIVSSVIHMVLGYHNNDFKKLPKEEGIMDALRPFAIPPGEYVMPFASNNKERASAEFVDKMNKGPVAFVNVFPSGQMAMGKQLVLWFVYSIVVSVFAAYIGGRALEPGVQYLSVFRFVGTTAFAGYGLALLQNSIWYGRAWGTTFKSVFDALVYALVTAGIFGSLWPS